MPLEVFEVPILALDGASFRESEEKAIMRHLVALMRYRRTAPALRIAVSLRGVTILVGYEYLQAARILKWKSIRAIIDRRESEIQAVVGFVQGLRSIKQAEWDDIETSMTQVVGFEALTAVYAKVFVDIVRRELSENVIAVDFDLDASVVIVELEGALSAEHEVLTRFFQVCDMFSLNTLQIVSHQGRPWRRGEMPIRST